MYWNYALWFPTMLAPAFLVTIIGAFDLTIAVHIGIAAAIQSAYIPHSFSACQQAETWHVLDNSTLSFFHVAGALNPTPIPAGKVCHDFVKERQNAIALV